MLGTNNQRLKRLRRLVSQSKARSSEGVFVAEGPKLVLEAINSGLRVEEVFLDGEAATSEAWQRVLAQAEEAGVVISEVVPGALQAVLSTHNPQPMAAVVASPHWELADLPTSQPVLVLVDVQDPGNVGTLCRTAEAAGFGGVVLCGNSVDVVNPKVVRAGAGATLRLPIVLGGPSPELLEALSTPQRPTVAAVLSPRAVAHTEAPLANAVLVLGNEANGLDDEVISVADVEVGIELAGPTESLNVAAAGAVLCFESLRQQRANSVAEVANKRQIEDNDY